MLAKYADKKLGKLAPRRDPRNLKLSNYLSYDGLPPYPPALQRGTNITQNGWTMMGNDTIGDCTAAALGHGIMLWTNANNKLVIPSEDDVISAYSGYTGYDPSTGANDTGADCNTALNYLIHTGVDGHKALSYAEVQITSPAELRTALDLFGFLYIGLGLPITAQDQADEWSVTDPSLTGNAAPGSWGGHCVIIVGYNGSNFDLITWGERIKMTTGFWDAYVEEAYAILSMDWLSPTKNCPMGLNLTQLQKDIPKV